MRSRAWERLRAVRAGGSPHAAPRTSAPRAILARARAAALAAAISGLLLLPRSPVVAADFDRLEVSEDAGTYHIQASLLMNAPAEAVVGALLDFEAQEAIGPPIREVKVVGATPDGGTLVRVVTDICIGPFCASVKQVQLLRFLPPGAIRATVIPDGGDLKSGHTAVEVSPDQGRTRVRMDCTFHPWRKRPFFVPKGWVLNAIRRQARQSAAGLEQIALRSASRTGARAPSGPQEERQGHPAGPRP